MPTGVYDRTKSKPNAGMFKKGEHPSLDTEFKKGKHYSLGTEFKPGKKIKVRGDSDFHRLPEYIRKQSESHKGQHSSPGTEIKQGQRLSPDTEFKSGQPQVYIPLGSNRPDFAGEMHPNWKGGISSVMSSIRNMGQYHEWRVSVFKRDNYICQKCGKRGGDLNAHHNFPVSKSPLFMLDINNGITLCKECHKLIHKRR